MGQFENDDVKELAYAAVQLLRMWRGEVLPAAMAAGTLGPMTLSRCEVREDRMVEALKRFGIDDV